MCSFIPKCHRFPFLVRCISGSRALLSFPIDDGAEMMVTSTMPPFFSSPPRPLGQVIPDIPKQKVRQSAALQSVAEVGNEEFRVLAQWDPHSDHANRIN